jgi:pimeloyl-ACP methyl ester carboxylesterase
MDRSARQPARRRRRSRPDPHRRERVLADRDSWLGSRIYYEGARTWGQSQPRSRVPTAVAVFPGDTTIRSLAERDHNVVHWTEFSRGGHFAAMEAPDLLVSDVREFFRQFR